MSAIIIAISVFLVIIVSAWALYFFNMLVRKVYELTMRYGESAFMASVRVTVLALLAIFLIKKGGSSLIGLMERLIDNFTLLFMVDIFRLTGLIDSGFVVLISVMQLYEIMTDKEE